MVILRSRFSGRRSRPTKLALLCGLLGLGLPAGSASAAVWGSFDATRIAYSTGALTGNVHSQFRGVITDHGDLVDAPTGQLTAEYLEGVDVFYTAMLSDGTGPTAGLPGTLSPEEQTALEDWIAAGGTLIVNADSNGFDGPFAPVYDSWLFNYSVTAFSFVFNVGTGMPNGVAHPITEGVSVYGMDGTTTFAYGAEGLLLGTGFMDDQPFLVVFEPSTGFADGGRILVIADHNLMTDNFIGDAATDNLVLAQNIVEWAAGECGNTIVESDEQCDDGNTEDGDGCDAACLSEGGGSGGEDTTGDTGSPDSGDGSTTAPADDSTTAPADDGSTTAEGSTSAASDTGAADGGEDGCGCAQGTSPGPWGLGLMMLLLAGRCRRGHRPTPDCPSPPSEPGR